MHYELSDRPTILDHQSDFPLWQAISLDIHLLTYRVVGNGQQLYMNTPNNVRQLTTIKCTMPSNDFIKIHNTKPERKFMFVVELSKVLWKKTNCLKDFKCSLTFIFTPRNVTIRITNILLRCGKIIIQYSEDIFPLWCVMIHCMQCYIQIINVFPKLCLCVFFFSKM